MTITRYLCIITVIITVIIIVIELDKSKKKHNNHHFIHHKDTNYYNCYRYTIVIFMHYKSPSFHCMDNYRNYIYIDIPL